MILASACEQSTRQQSSISNIIPRDTTSTPESKEDRPSRDNDTSKSEIYAGYPYSTIVDTTAPMNERTDTLTLRRLEHPCPCANWITLEDITKYENTDSFEIMSLNLYTADTNLHQPFYFDPYRHLIIVTGHYYKPPYYTLVTMRPGGRTKKEPTKNRAFKYNTLKTILNPTEYTLKDDTTITFVYNAISCECAHWTNVNEDPRLNDYKVYYYLERGNPNTPDADKLWEGDNLPLIVKLRGRLVSLSGYPDGYMPHKGKPESARVFRYSSLKVIKSGDTKH